MDKKMYGLLWFNTYMVVILFILFMTLVGLAIYQYDGSKDSYIFSNAYDFIPGNGVDFGNKWGFYNTQGYFCVRTKDRSPEEVAETTFHELAHYYVEEVDRNHFCNYGR